MNSRHFEQTLPRAFDLIRRTVLVAVLLAMLSLGAFAPRAAQASPDEHTNLLMQFTAGGHVLGFRRDAVYVASADHALRIEFVGGADIAPVADAPASNAGRALSLSKVSYPNVWDGISVSYQATAGGIAKSSYLLGVFLRRCPPPQPSFRQPDVGRRPGVGSPRAPAGLRPGAVSRGFDPGCARTD